MEYKIEPNQMIEISVFAKIFTAGTVSQLNLVRLIGLVVKIVSTGGIGL